MHEEIVRGRISEVLAGLQEQTLRGEFVIVMGGLSCSGLLVEQEPLDPAQLLTELPSLLAKLISEGTDKKTAIGILAKQLNLPKKVVYNTIVKQENIQEDDE